MKKTLTLRIPVKALKIMLQGVRKVRPAIIIKVKDHKLQVLTASDANLIFVLSTITLPDELDNGEELELPIIDVTKLQRICDFAEGEYIDLAVTDNVVKFKNSGVQVKFYLAEKLIVTVPQQVTPEGFDKFHIDFQVTIPKEKLVQIDKAQSFVSGSVTDVKAYFYMEDNKLYVEVGDKLTASTDSFRLLLSEDFSGRLDGDLPIKYDIWSMLTLFDKDIVLKASLIRNRGLSGYVLFIEQNDGTIETRYLMKSTKG